MPAYIKTLQDSNGDVVLPRTRPEAIIMQDGTTLLSDNLVEFVDDGVGTPTMPTMSGSLIPDTDIAYDLGDDTHRWKDLYLSGTTIHLGDNTITTDNGNLVLPQGTVVSDGLGGTVASITQDDLDAAINGLVDSAPGALDTLNELSAALNDDANFATTVTNSIATKLNSSSYTAADILSKLITVDGAGSGLDADTLDGINSTGFVQKYTASVTIPDTTTYQQIARVEGDSLASGIRMYIKGTSGSVVINVLADILVNHSQDIVIRSISGKYTQIYIQVVSSNDEDFDIKLMGTGSVSNTSVTVTIVPMSNESVTFTSTSTYSGATISHLTVSGSESVTNVG